MKPEEYKFTLILLQILRNENMISDSVAGSIIKKFDDEWVLSKPTLVRRKGL